MTNSGLTLNMVVSDALSALVFYEKTFNGIRGEIYEFSNKKGENEANVTINGVCLRLIDENKAYDCVSPKKDETGSIWLQLTVDNADKTLEKAVLNGAEVLQEPNEFMGVRNAIVLDPFGYTWTINQIMKDITFEERYAIYENLHKEQEK